MKRYLYTILTFTFLIILIISSFNLGAQTLEWRLINPTYNSTDPDGAGPAMGSVTFTMQIHTTSGTVSNVNTISTGWSYPSASLMIPTTPGCAIVSNPANVSISPAFTAAGFSFSTVNQCGNFSQTTGGQTFDKRTVGTLNGTSINIDTAWVDVYTVTLWTLNSTSPYGYVIINSGAGGSPGEFTTYAVADNLANQYTVNSLTYTSPLAFSTGTVPVLFTNFDANCTNNGTLISWSTGSEFNSSYFELQRSVDANNWISIATINASGNSAIAHTYHQLDLDGGAMYYRIKQVDIDGHFIYTNIVRTNCESKKIDMVIYPVPAQNILNVVIKSDKPLKTQLFLIDAVGKIVRRINATLFNGSNSFTINLNGLSTGEYLIRSNDPGVELNKRFNIIR